MLLHIIARSETILQSSSLGFREPRIHLFYLMICLIKTGVASAANLELSPIRVEMIKLISMQEMIALCRNCWKLYLAYIATRGGQLLIN